MQTLTLVSKGPRIRDRIRSLQTLRGWRHRDLAAVAGISKSALRKWLSPAHIWHRRQLVLLAGALGVDLPEIVGEALATRFDNEPIILLSQDGRIVGAVDTEGGAS